MFNYIPNIYREYRRNDNLLFKELRKVVKGVEPDSTNNIYQKAKGKANSNLNTIKNNILLRFPWVYFKSFGWGTPYEVLGVKKKSRPPPLLSSQGNEKI